MQDLMDAHEDGRHESPSREDRVYWWHRGCPGCRARYNAHGLPLEAHDD